MNTSKQKPRRSSNIFKISEEELKFQVENHDTLPITKSSRGIAALTVLALLAIGLLIVFALNLFSSETSISYLDVLLGLVIYLPLLFFVYKGHLWAILALALWYTFDKLYTAIALSDHFNIGALVFWLIGIAPLWIAFRVERAYRKQKEALK